jgi:hypothetical protein
MLANILIKLLFIIVVILIFSLKKDDTHVSNNAYPKFKIILYYDGSNEINLRFIDSIWKEITYKYITSGILSFAQININNNKYYKNYIFNSSPNLYILNNDQNIIYKYNGQYTFNPIDKFIVDCVSNF